jgi:AraC-like DNA-binding protein
MTDSGCDAYRVLGATSSELHGHRHFLLTLITRGRGTQILNGEEIPFCEGDLFLLSPVDFHRNVLADGESYDFFGVKFNFESLDPRLFAIFGYHTLPIHLSLQHDSYEAARGIFSELAADERDALPEGISDVYKKTLVEQLMILILRRLDQTAPSAKSPFAVRMLGYIYSNFSEDIGVADAAAFAGYTPNYFNTLFRTTFGMPFFEYLRSLRLEYAKNLILAGELSMTEVALESGFLSLSHFSRRFKEKYGVAPMQLRRS